MSDTIRPVAAAPLRNQTLVRPTAPAAPAAAKPPQILASAKAAPAAAPAGPSVSGIFGAVKDGLQWALLGPAVKEFKTRTVVRAPSVNYADPAELKAAIDHLAASKDAEAAALAKLGPRAADYQRLADLCGNRIIARDVLLKMLLDGRLTSLKDLAGKGDALTYLGKMATQPLPQGMDRQALVTGVIQEMDDPVKLAQDDKGTCAATTATVVLDRKSPAEYARLVQEMAGPDAKTTTTNGTVLTRNADWADNNDGGRTPSMRMLEPALMQLGNPLLFLTYDNNRDAYTLENPTMADQMSHYWDNFKAESQTLASKIALPGGLETAGTNRVLEALTGDKYQMIYAVTRLNRAFTWNRVEQAIAAGKSVPCGMSWEGGGHEILLDKIEGGFCYFNNPWGETDRMSVEEFRSNLNGVNIKKS